MVKEIMFSKEDFFGGVIGNRFIVHKLPEHVFNLYGGFGCSKKRLMGMHKMGVHKVIIFYHPNFSETKCFKTTIEKWLDGRTHINRTGNKNDEQVFMEISDLEGGVNG